MGTTIRAMRVSPAVRGLFSLYTIALLSGLGWGMILPTIPVLTTAFGISVGAAAQTVTAYAFGRFVGTPLSGVMLDRLGTRAALVVGPLAGGTAALLAAATPWFGALLLAMLVIGAGDSVWAMGREVAGIDLVRQDQRGRVLSGFHGIHNGGLTLGPLIGGFLTETLGFRTVFIGYGVFATVAVLLALITHDPAPHRVAYRDRDGVKGWSVGSLRRRLWALLDLFKQIEPHLRPTYVVLVLATTTSFTFRLTMQSMLPLFAVYKLGLGPTEVGLLFTISGAFVFAMILPAGFVLDKVGRKWATVPSTGIPAVAFLLLPFVENFFQITLILILMGIANGMSLGSLATSTYDVVPPSARGRLQAARRTLAEMGGMGGPLLSGFLANAFNPGVPFLAYAPLLMVSAILLALIGRETLAKP